MPASSLPKLQLSSRLIFCLVFALPGMAVAAAPTLSSIYPSSAVVGSAGFTLTLSGSNFLPTSIVRWNGSARPVTFDSPNQLTAQISAQDVELLGNNAVTVSNGGGGLSSPAAFTVYLGLPTNDLIYDSHRDVLWASVPSSAGPELGNSIVSIDPYIGVLGASLWVGSEPGKLALSSDGSTLWVAFLGSPSVRKVDLNTMTLTPVDLYFPGGWGGNIYAAGLAAYPGSTQTVAVAAGFVAIYDDATQRPKTGSTGATALAFGDEGTTLYGFSNGLSIFTVGDTGITSTQTFNSGSYSDDLRYDDGRLYLTSGQVLDGVTGNLLGTFAASGPVAPDSKLGRVFILNSSPNSANPDQVTAFDVSTFVPLGSFGVGGVDTTAGSLVRWGEDGLAFRTDAGVFALRSTAVQNLSGMPADISVSSTAPASSTTGANTVVKLTVKNIGPNAVSHASLLETFSAGPIVVVSASSSQGYCASVQVVRCDLGPMAAGASATVSVTVIPTTAGKLICTAAVSSTLPDPKIANNTAKSAISVTGAAYNVVPVLSSISPQSAAAGSPTLILTVIGSNFSAGSTVNWNGAALPTTFGGSTSLTATVDASLMKTINSAQITVINSVPGGGTSAALPFSVFSIVALDANDIVFDPFTRNLYASVPSTATQVTGNSIVPINPLTGKLGKPVFIGSEPTRLALSDDGEYLYVVLSGANAVRRMSLPALTAGTQFTTASPLFGAYTASDVAVMPGNHDAVASVGYSDGIQVWDVTSTGATSLPLTRSLINDVYEGSVLAWGSATNLYSNDEGLSPSSLHRFTVGSTSFAETDSTYLDAVDGKITFSGGLIFSDGGGVVDPSPVPPQTPELVGRLTGGGSSTADTSINGAFFLSGNSYDVTSRVITASDATHFVTTGSLQLDNLTGDAFDLIRWGGDGLGFRTATDFWGEGSGRVVLLRGSFVLPPSSTPNPVPSALALSPASVTSPGANTWVTITGSNFVPGSVALWNGSARTTVFVNSGEVRVAIPASDLAIARTAKILVNNPLPGGGKSAALAFTVK